MGSTRGSTAQRRLLTYRVQGIPAEMTENQVKTCFHCEDRQFVEIRSLTPEVTDYDGTDGKTATIFFNAAFPREPRLDPDHGYGFTVDRDFMGFTPLNEPSDDVAADIVAVTGLAGHAYGSWANSEREMWLRDYLPKDIMNKARVLIYGYPSQIRGANLAKSIISDYGTAFRHDLLDIRDHVSCRDRPLILIGHSLGALIIKQAITDLPPNVRSRLPVRTLIFFGAPHYGLRTEALETIVRGQPPDVLISELKRDSPTLSGLADRFLMIADNLNIYSYYESKPTKTVIMKEDGTLAREGPAIVMVEKASALLNHPSEHIKREAPGDHSEMVKISKAQGGIYRSILGIIKESLRSASELYARSRQDETKSDDTYLRVNASPEQTPRERQTSLQPPLTPRRSPSPSYFGNNNSQASTLLSRSPEPPPSRPQAQARGRKFEEEEEEISQERVRGTETDESNALIEVFANLLTQLVTPQVQYQSYVFSHDQVRDNSQTNRPNDFRSAAPAQTAVVETTLAGVSRPPFNWLCNYCTKDIPTQGLRFHCSECSDFDIHGQCYATLRQDFGEHRTTHKCVAYDDAYYLGMENLLSISSQVQPLLNDRRKTPNLRYDEAEGLWFISFHESPDRVRFQAQNIPAGSYQVLIEMQFHLRRSSRNEPASLGWINAAIGPTKDLEAFGYGRALEDGPQPLFDTLFESGIWKKWRPKLPQDHDATAANGTSWTQNFDFDSDEYISVGDDGTMGVCLQWRGTPQQNGEPLLDGSIRAVRFEKLLEGVPTLTSAELRAIMSV